MSSKQLFVDLFVLQKYVEKPQRFGIGHGKNYLAFVEVNDRFLLFSRKAQAPAKLGLADLYEKLGKRIVYEFAFLVERVLLGHRKAGRYSGLGANYILPDAWHLVNT